jgi:hypothetical protein
MKDEFQKGRVVVSERGVQLISVKCLANLDTTPSVYRVQWSIDNPREWTRWLDWFTFTAKLRHVYGPHVSIVYRKDAGGIE